MSGAGNRSGIDQPIVAQVKENKIRVTIQGKGGPTTWLKRFISKKCKEKRRGLKVEFRKWPFVVIISRSPSVAIFIFITTFVVLAVWWVTTESIRTGAKAPRITWHCLAIFHLDVIHPVARNFRPMEGPSGRGCRVLAHRQRQRQQHQRKHQAQAIPHMHCGAGSTIALRPFLLVNKRAYFVISLPVQYRTATQRHNMD